MDVFQNNNPKSQISRQLNVKKRLNIYLGSNMKKNQIHLTDDDIGSINIEVFKRWLAQKAINNLNQFENEDGTLDITYTANSYWEFCNWVNDFTKQDDLCSMIFDYFEYGSGVKYSDSIIQEKIQNTYKLKKDNILKLGQEERIKDNFISDFSSFFKLNKIETDILYFVLISEYTNNFKFMWITEPAEDIYEKIHLVTNQSCADLEKALRPTSTLIKEKILLKSDEQLMLNLDWENYFFKGELHNRKRALKIFMKDGPYQSKNKNLPLCWKNDDEIPLDHFLYLESINPLNNLFHGEVVHLNFDHLPKPESMILEKSLFGAISEEFRLNPFILSMGTQCEKSTPQVLMDGNVRIAYKKKEFEILLSEIKSRYPEYYLKEFSKYA